MKYIIILGDGMADYPIKEFDGKTPLMAADTPNIDSLSKMGRSGKLTTVPADMPPGSEIANMAVLGYDVKKVYQGRGVRRVLDDQVVVRWRHPLPSLLFPQ